MISIFKPELLLPIVLLLLQAFVLLFLSFALLKRLRVLKEPYAGMEYSQIIVAATFIFCVLFISTASITAVFQSFKIFQNIGNQVASDTFSKFSQFFIVIIFFELVFGGAFFLTNRYLFGGKVNYSEIEQGNIPTSILIAVVSLCFAIVLKYSACEIIDYLIPQIITFR